MLFPLRPGPLPPATGVLNGWQITSYFGGRVDPLTGRAGTHGGMDLAYYGCTGEPMLAVADGWVTQGWDSSGGGNWSGLTLDDGSYWGYGHAQRFEPPSGRNRRVQAGDVIGYVGTSGGSTGPHLHIAYRPPGSSRYADPYDLLAAAGQPIPTEEEELMAAIDDIRAEFVNQDTRTRAALEKQEADVKEWVTREAERTRDELVNLLVNKGVIKG